MIQMTDNEIIAVAGGGLFEAIMGRGKVGSCTCFSDDSRLHDVAATWNLSYGESCFDLCCGPKFGVGLGTHWMLTNSPNSPGYLSGQCKFRGPEVTV